MSPSRFLSALGAALITIGTTTGLADAFGPRGTKYALIVVALGGAVNTFSERLQGGASKQ